MRISKKDSISFSGTRAGLAPLDTRPLWEWAAENVVLPPSYARRGAFDVSDAIYIKEPMQALLDYTCREVVCRSGVQCLKTLISEIYILYCIVESPGPLQWIHPTPQEATNHAEERFDDLLNSCKKARDLYSPERYTVKKSFRKFRHGMYLRLDGAANIKDLQRKSIKTQICSEVWNWLPGHLAEAEQRTTQFGDSRKRYIESQAGNVGEDLDSRWLVGSQEILHFRCVECGHSQPYKWSTYRDDRSRAGMVWDENETTRRPDGRWIESAVIPTIRYVCVKCGHAHFDEPRTRRLMLNSSHYVRGNEDAPHWLRSFSWNQLANISIRWVDLWRKWILAMEADAQGEEHLKIQFIQKVLAETYDPSAFFQHHKPRTYEVQASDKWPDEHIRFMTVDVQADLLFWFVVRGWSKAGDSRLHDCGELTSWDAVAAKAGEWSCAGQNVGVDSGYDTRTVYMNCAIKGWLAMKGDDTRNHYIYVSPKSKQRIELPYKLPMSQPDPALGVRTRDEIQRIHKRIGGKRCNLLTWCNYPIKEILFRLRDGRAKAQWLAPDSIGEEWMRQMRAERKVQYYDSRTGHAREAYKQIGKRPNHLLDCEAMQVVMAHFARVLGE